MLGHADATLRGCKLYGNTAYHRGGAAYVNAWADLRFVGCRIGSCSPGEGNQAQHTMGGGISVRNAYCSLSSGTKLEGNTAGNRGGGFDLALHLGLSSTPGTFECELTADSTTAIAGNHAGAEGGAGSVVTEGTGLVKWVDPEAKLNGTNVYGNSAGAGPHSIVASGLYVGTLSDCTLDSATFSGHSGAAVTCANTGRDQQVLGSHESSIKRCTFENNGVGIHLCDDVEKSDIQSCSFSGNSQEDSVKTHIVIQNFSITTEINILYCTMISAGTLVGVDVDASLYSTSPNGLMIAWNNILGFTQPLGRWGVRVAATSTDTIDAQRNYWGDPTGPYLNAGDPPGASRVSANVDYSNWLTTGEPNAGP